MPLNDHRSSRELIEDIDVRNARISRDQRDLLADIAMGDRREVWRDSGARDMAQWLAIRYGISDWKARRWIAAGHALEALPRLAEAFTSGELGIDKVVELARFATPQTEGRLIGWAATVSSGCVRRRADRETRRSIEDARAAERDRSVSCWYYDEGTRFAATVDLPAADGAVVERALDRLAHRLRRCPARRTPTTWTPGGRTRWSRSRRPGWPATPIPIGPRWSSTRRSRRWFRPQGRRGRGQGRRRGRCEVEGGGVIHPETVRRLLCNGRVQTVIEDGAGEPLGFGRLSRVPSAAMMRQLLRYRDRECRFPGCGAQQYAQAHHVVWWERGGGTDLENLVLLCHFHHKLVHEYGWSIRRAGGEVEWRRPDGSRFRAGPAPPGRERLRAS